MGYDLHITRAEDWVESHQCPISAEEWLAMVASDPELQIDQQNGPYFAIWKGKSDGSDSGWFDWSAGRISTKNPDRAVLGKMLQLAGKLGAKILGDDGESYSSTDQGSDKPEEEVQAFVKRERVFNTIGLVLMIGSVVWFVTKVIRWITG